MFVELPCSHEILIDVRLKCKTLIFTNDNLSNLKSRLNVDGWNCSVVT